jgi:hypothetical protein
MRGLKERVFCMKCDRNGSDNGKRYSFPERRVRTNTRQWLVPKVSNISFIPSGIKSANERLLRNCGL